ncbi:MAG: GNAT family N-acetyltransferase [Proteobacteria bacterium]|nr:GNAT family N-acetyltransferase [Pseudomonadota bacterium]MDA0927167.1 GNAT family N-acetyltransferase [Pseudomonadota bacterium]
MTDEARNEQAVPHSADHEPMSTPAIRVRIADDRDLDPIRELYAEWGKAFGNSRNDQYFVAELDDQIVAAINLAFEDPVLVVRSLYVKEACRHRGIARALLSAVDAELGLAEAYSVCFQEQEQLGVRLGMQKIGGLTAPAFLRQRLADLQENYPNVILMKRSLGIEVKPVHVDDLRQVMGLIAEFQLAEVRKLSENDIRSIYSKIISAGGVVFGAFRGTRLLGTCTLNVCANLSWSGRPYGMVGNIIVTESERNHGIGRYLLLMASRSAISKDCYKLALMTQQRTEATSAFYRSAGFSADKVGYQIRFDAPLTI